MQQPLPHLRQRKRLREAPGLINMVSGFLFAMHLLLLPFLCAANNTPFEVRMELHATHYAVGVEVAYKGDDNGNLKAAFFYRIHGQAAWQEGVEMSYVRERKRIYASAFRFNQNQKVEIKVLLTDADGGDTTELLGNATTKTLVMGNPASAKKYVSPTGNDAGPGTKAKPFKTISRVMKSSSPTAPTARRLR